MQMKSLDPACSIQQQMSENAQNAGPVVLVNLFTLDPADEAAFLNAWTDDAAFMKARPGFISTQLHRAIGKCPTYFNYAIWETMDVFRAAFTDPDFRARLADYPSSVIASPHLFQRVAVPGICVA